jgi:enamine deaminase RidA (YjgF/YER057c/UK114 family)
MTTAEQRLADLGITLPEPTPPLASYVPFTKGGNLVFISGQVCFQDGKLTHTGLVGRDVTLEDATGDARVCAINVLAQLRAAAGGTLDNIRRIVKLTVFVASSEGFHAQPQVANGASDLLVEVFGESGRHARSAVGVAALPLHATVEIEAIAELA